MAQYSIWILEESNISISNGVVLDGITQGSGVHLMGQTITLDTPAWKEVLIDDSEGDFADNDSSQTLDGAQVIDGLAAADGTRVEAEYTLTLSDGATTYTLIGFNVVEPGTSYGTIEGLAFIGGPGGFPPVGVPLTVVATAEGPSGATAYADYATPICLTTGAMIDTPVGPVAIEALTVGDLVDTLDHGPQPLRWIGQAEVPGRRLRREPAFVPVRIAAGAFGPGCPSRDMLVSQQHRFLLGGWRAALHFAADEVLVAARHLVNDSDITLAVDVRRVTYFHLMFDAHEIIRADGVLTESFLPGDAALAAVPEATRDELLALFPDLATHPASIPAARPLLRRAEARLLVP
jgi:hypothetical protein